MASDRVGELPLGAVVRVLETVELVDGSTRARIDAGWLTAITKEGKDSLASLDVSTVPPVPPAERQPEGGNTILGNTIPTCAGCEAPEPSRKAPLPARPSKEGRIASRNTSTLVAPAPLPPPTNLAIELLPRETLRAAARLKMARKALLSSGMGVELRGTMSERVT